MRRMAFLWLVLTALVACFVASRCSTDTAPAPPATPPPTAAPTPAAPVATATIAHQRVPAPIAFADEQLDPTGLANDTGTLIVHAVHAVDATAAIGMNLRLEAALPENPTERDQRGHSVAVQRCAGRARVDPLGVARFDAVPADTYALRNDRLDHARHLVLHAGATLHVDYLVQPGLRIEGTVTNLAGVPIAGANLELLSEGPSSSLEHVASSDGLGKFVVRDVHVNCTLLARAEGHQAGVVAVRGIKNAKDVRFLLDPNAGAVSGSVETEMGQLLANAWVQIGTATQPGARQLAVRTNEHGQFRAFGLVPGEHRWSATAPDLQAAGSCFTGEFLRIVMKPGEANIDEVVRAIERPDASPPTGSFRR